MPAKKKKYSGYVYLGTDENGKEIRRYCSASTPLGLERKKIELRKKYASGELSINNALVRDFAKKWLKTKEKRARSTYNMYEAAIRLYINPAIGHMIVNNVRQIHLQEIIDNLADKPRTSQKVKITLNQIFKDAKINKLCNDRPTENVDLPTYRSKRKRRLNDIELHSLSKAELSPDNKLLCMLMLRCGLALNEACALDATCIDHDNKKLIIRGVIDLAEPVGSEKKYKPFPKTDARNRRIPIPNDLYDLILKHNSDGFYISQKDGSPLTNSSIRARWNTILGAWNRAAGGKSKTNPKTKRMEFVRAAIGEDITMYFFRHEYASQLFEAGYTLPEVMYLLGHSTPKMALEVYSHIDSEKITADRLNETIKIHKKTSV